MKALTRKKIAQLFDVDPRLITDKLKELGISHRKKLFPIELELLKQHIGSWEK